MELSIIVILLIGIFIFLYVILATLQNILKVILSVASTYIKMFELSCHILKGQIPDTKIDMAQKER